MAISDYQIRTVIRAYMKVIKGRTQSEREYHNLTDADEIIISSEAVKNMMYERIEKRLSEKLKGNGPRR